MHNSVARKFRVELLVAEDWAAMTFVCIVRIPASYYIVHSTIWLFAPLCTVHSSSNYNSLEHIFQLDGELLNEAMWQIEVSLFSIFGLTELPICCGFLEPGVLLFRKANTV